MLEIVRDMLEERQSDLERMYALSEYVGSKLDRVDLEDFTDEEKYLFDDAAANTLKSSIYMCCYNLVECISRECVNSIYDYLSDNEVSYSELRASFQKHLWDCAVKNNNSGKQLHKDVNNDFEALFARATLDVEKVFNGNVDKRKIRLCFEQYGVDIQAGEESRGGEDLVTLKEYRNALAHGEKSFSQQGAMDTLESTIEMSKRITVFMNSLIFSVEQYLEKEHYKAPM